MGKSMNISFEGDNLQEMDLRFMILKKKVPGVGLPPPGYILEAIKNATFSI